MPLTERQRKALASAPKAARAKMLANFKRQDSTPKPAAPARKAPRTGARPARLSRSIFDGRSNMMWNYPGQGCEALPLRLQLVHSTSSHVSFLGFTQADPNAALTPGADPMWTTRIMITDVVSGTNMNAAANAYGVNMPSTGLTGHWQPLAYTVKVSCTDPLQTASGNVLITRLNGPTDLHDRATPWTTFADSITAARGSHVTTAQALALKPLVFSLYPSESTQATHWSEITTPTAGAYTLTQAADEVYLRGFTPLLIRNPAGATLTFQVVTRWRFRYDAGVVAPRVPAVPGLAADVYSRAKADAMAAFHGMETTSEAMAAAYGVAKALAGYGVEAAPIVAAM